MLEVGADSLLSRPRSNTEHLLLVMVIIHSVQVILVIFAKEQIQLPNGLLALNSRKAPVLALAPPLLLLLVLDVVPPLDLLQHELPPLLPPPDHGGHLGRKNPVVFWTWVRLQKFMMYSM